MKGVRSPLGYTVVEVMIVLAVSGIMFLVAANFINGKQQKTSFSDGVNSMASQIQDVIEQVTDGEYSDVPFDCAVSGTSLQISLTGDPGKTQGSNPDCVFVGKFFHFSEAGNTSNYEVFPLAAARSATSLGPDVTPVVGNGIDLTSHAFVPQNLQIVTTGPKAGVKIGGKAGTYYGFGFTQSQGNAVSAPDTNGAQTVNLVYSTALLSKNDTESAAVGSITGTVALADSASFYLTDGNRCAQISVGAGQSSQLDVNVTIEAPGTC